MVNRQKPNVAPLVVIVGVTASGKSALAMDIAKKCHGEIICADSRTVYRGMDIGTAKPSLADQSLVAHHAIDLINPDQTFTAADFKTIASGLMDDVTSRHRLPIIVGGTGLYVDGLIFDFAFLPSADAEEREYLQALSVLELQHKIAKLGINMPVNSQNPRHLIRAIETNGAVPVRKDLRQNTLVLGIDIARDVAIDRISNRVDAMIEAGLETEVRSLSSLYGWQAPGMSAVGYQEWRQYFEDDSVDFDVVVSNIKRNTIQYARRQRTWFRRNKSIIWVTNMAEVDVLVNSFLQNQ